MKKIMLIITCVLLMFLLACSSGSNNDSENITYRVFSDYAVYSDIDSLSEHSDFVIEGVVMSSRVEEIDTTIYFVDGVPIQEIEDDKINPNFIPGKEYSQQPEPYIRPYNVFTVKVTEVYKGDISENELIDVAILGGELFEQMWISENDVLLEDSNTYVLFLKGNHFFPYTFLINPLQASYEVKKTYVNNVINKEIVELNKDNPFKIDTTDLERIKSSKNLND